MTKEIDVTKLDDSGCLSAETIAEYDYIDLKKKFERIMGIIQVNQLVFIEVGDDLHIEIDNKFFLIPMSKYIEEIKNTRVVSLNDTYYRDNIDLAYELVSKLISTWNRLNEIERYILYNFSFNGSSSKLTDEEMIDNLMTYKNKYFQYKKSAYIKISIMLGLNEKLLDLKGLIIE